MWNVRDKAIQENKKKIEIPTVSKLRFCDGIKQLRGCLTDMLLPFW